MVACCSDVIHGIHFGQAHPCMRTTNADKAFHRHSDCGVDGDGEGDLGDGEEDGDEVGEGVECIVPRYLRQAEYEVGKNDATGVGDKKHTKEVLENRLEIQIFVLEDF